MGLETGTYIDSLVATNPVGDTDDRTTADDHLRLLKSTIKNSFPNVDGAVNPTPTELNLLVGLVGVLAQLPIAQEWTKTQNFNATVLTDGANISWDAAENQACSVTLGDNRTLDNPTNLKDGATYILLVKQDGTGGRTLAFGSAYKWPSGTVPILSTGVNAIDVFSFYSDGTSLFGNFSLNYS